MKRIKKTDGGNNPPHYLVLGQQCLTFTDYLRLRDAVLIVKVEVLV